MHPQRSVRQALQLDATVDDYELDPMQMPGCYSLRLEQRSGA
jgi:hypothetical protein